MAKSSASSSAGRRRAPTKTKPRKRTSSGPHKTSKKKPAKAAGRPQARAKPKRVAKPKSAARPKATLTRSLTVAIAVGTLTIALAAAYLFWFRDSSFVAVEKVAVEGIEGPEADAASAALTEAAKTMTTLNVDEGQLATSVSGFATVVAISAEPDFPHGLTINVIDRPPVLRASAGGQTVAVAADGTLLDGVAVPEGTLPTLEVESLPAEGKLSGEPLALAEVAGAAPEPLRPLVEDLSFGDKGIEVVLRGDIPVFFGDPGGAEQKWTAAAAVLASPRVKTLTHVDVRVPERPSIGGAAPPPTEEAGAEAP